MPCTRVFFFVESGEVEILNLQIHDFVAAVAHLSELEAAKLLKRERKQRDRHEYKYRLHARFNKLRCKRERTALEIFK